MTFGSSILVRFWGVHSYRSHSDTVAVLSSSVHLAQESRPKKQEQPQNQQGHVVYAALRAPAAAMSMSHAHGSMTQLNKYRTVSLKKVKMWLKLK